MQIDWWTLALQAINAAVLIWLLARFLFRPVAAMIEQRRQEAGKALADAAASKEAAAALQKQVAAEQAAIAADRSAVLEKAGAEAKAEAGRIIEAARVEIARLREAAQSDLQREREKSLSAAIAEVNRLALDMVARLLQRLPDEVKVSAFIPGLVAAFGALPASARDGAASGASLRLIAPRPLTDGERTAVEEAFAQRVGRVPAFDAVVDRELLAGLELQAAHVVVRNSFRADLEQFASALQQVRSEQALSEQTPSEEAHAPQHA